jgi:hypothetical protein
MDAWPDSVHGFPVHHERIGKGVALKHPIVGVLHTTEGSSDESTAAHFHANPIEASHFAVDADSIIQFRGLDETAGSLRHSSTAPESPNLHAVQIEIAFKSSTKPYLPPEGAVARVAALIAYISDFHDIPLRIPNAGWHDDGSDIEGIWASNNSRRRWAAASGRWPNQRGWWMHLEVPWQDPSWHWDAGAIRRSVLLDRAKAMMPGGAAPAAAAHPSPAHPAPAAEPVLTVEPSEPPTDEEETDVGLTAEQEQALTWMRGYLEGVVDAQRGIDPDETRGPLYRGGYNVTAAAIGSPTRASISPAPATDEEPAGTPAAATQPAAGTDQAPAPAGG